MNEDLDIFSQRLCEERKANGFSQRKFAEILGIPHSTYQAYELIGRKGGSQPSIDMIRLLAKTLEVTTDYLLGLED